MDLVDNATYQKYSTCSEGVIEARCIGCLDVDWYTD